MALAAATAWEVRTAGSDTLCSGGYVTGSAGTDYSQQNAAQYTGTDLVIDGTTNTLVSSATHNFVTADVGNLMRITAGTGFTTGFFQIVSVAANKATLDRSAGTLGSTAGTFAVGGALATPGLAVANLVAGHTIYASGSYTTTTNTANIAGGRLDFTTTGTQVAFNKFIGYGAARGDGTKYTITLGATFAGPVITTNNANSYNDIRNVAIVGNSTADSQAVIHVGRSNRIVNLKVSGFTGASAFNALVDMQISSFLKDFEISGGSTSTSASLNLNGAVQVMDGWVHGNAGRGVQFTAGSPQIIRVISAEHTGANGYGFYNTTVGDVDMFECAAWNNASGDYFLGSSASTFTCVRCVSGGSGGYNWDNLTGPDSVNLYYCAAKTNTTALYRTTPNINIGLVTLTGDPWTNRTAGNFSLNNTAGAGAALRGIASTIFGLTTTYADVGPAQHQDSAGGGGSGPNIIVSSGASSRGASW